MEFKINITYGLVVVCILLIIVGFYSGFSWPRELKENTCFSESDLNVLLAASYFNSDCEKLGLTTSVYVQQDANGVSYGVPICLDKIKKTGGID